jgi:uncharacterized protein YdhG (YjbR/CyaY superfamily)
VARTAFESVDQYLAAQPPEARATLERVRTAIRKALPGAEERISYQIPTYRLHGSYVVYFAGWKEHFSLYPANARLLSAFKRDLAPYEVRKATIRFPLAKRVPVKLIAGLAKFMAGEAKARAEQKRVRPKKG